MFKLNPKILFELQTEHNSDRACYEDTKYAIIFYINLIFEGGVAFLNLT